MIYISVSQLVGCDPKVAMDLIGLSHSFMGCPTSPTLIEKMLVIHFVEHSLNPVTSIKFSI